MQKILVLVNPVAGAGKGRFVAEELRQYCAQHSPQSEVRLGNGIGHLAEIASTEKYSDWHSIAAAGGDGTVNEVATALLGGSVSLGIIPIGSGNGLARHLNYSSNPLKAFSQIETGNSLPTDLLRINSYCSFNVSGFGFDGFISWKFNQGKRRGWLSYTRLGLSHYLPYPESEMELEVNGSVLHRSLQMVVMANATQFGNKAIIAPKASLTDGLMDLVLVRKAPLYHLPTLLYQLFNGRLRDSAWVESLKCQHFTLRSKTNLHLHIDGESAGTFSTIEASIEPGKIKVIHPSK